MFGVLVPCTGGENTILEVTGRGLEDKGVCVVGQAFSQEKGIHGLFESIWNGG